MSLQSPILVTGARRAGTTWTGKMLGLAKNARPVGEIFNPQMGALEARGIFDRWFVYVTQSMAREYAIKLRECLKRIEKTPEYIYGKSPFSPRFYWHHLKYAYTRLRYPVRLVIKDPIAAFSAEWFGSTFSMDVVVVVRHPAAVVNSLLRVNWVLDFRRHILSQEELVRDHLGDYVGALERVGMDDRIENASLQWLITYKVLHDYITRNPHWIVVRHEDLAVDPLAGFKNLYSRLGLLFDEAASREIVAHTQNTNPVVPPEGETTYLKRDSRALASLWRRVLSHEEIAQIRELVEPVASLYYDETDW
ncbi:MAG: hypothetical protein D6791_09570 [Chloroflexi bacterium]|nr:MAG: hypothetical protein D6791_09570 [Chloroflexota bacterium]